MSNFQQFADYQRKAINEQYQKSTEKVGMYEKIGLLEGLNPIEKVQMANLLHNQLGHILKETTNQTNLGGATYPGGTGEQVAGVILPLVRKVFADLISAKEFVSIQPLQMPTGLVFYLDFKYANSKSPFTSGDSVYGITDTGADVSGGLYGAGRFTYSLAPNSASASTTVTSGSFKDVWFDSSLSGSVARNEIKLVSVPTSSLPSYDVLGVRGFTLSGSGVVPANVYQQYTVTDGTGTNVIFVVSGSSASVVNGTALVYYQKQTVDNARGDFEDRTGSLNIPEFYAEWTSKQVSAKTRKLKGQWTQEMIQDVKAYQGIDLESEITGMMSDSIAREIDLEVLDMISSAVPAGGTRDYWTAENNIQINSTGTAFTPMTSGYYNSQQDWFRTLGTKINKVSNSILQKTVRGEANFIVTSPKVANVLESMAGYMSDAEVGKATSGLGNTRVGSFNSQYKVFKNPYYTENRLLMGFKGANFLEAGAALCPYIPLEVTPLIYNYNTATPNKFMLTRYARTMLRQSFFGDVIVGGLHTV